MISTASSLDTPSFNVLKCDLLQYARSAPLPRELKAELRRQFGGFALVDDGKMIELFDSFVFEHRIRDGRTVLECYLNDHPKLAEDDRAMLCG